MSSFFKNVKAAALVPSGDYDVLAMVLTEMGATVKKLSCAPKLPRGISHLLVHPPMVTPELAVAAEAARVPVLGVSWVHQSMAEGKMLPLSSFLVDIADLKTTRAEARAITSGEFAANASSSNAAVHRSSSPTALHKQLSTIPGSDDVLFHSSQRDKELTPSRTYAGRRRRGGPLKATLSRASKSRRTKVSESDVVHGVVEDTPTIVACAGAAQLATLDSSQGDTLPAQTKQTTRRRKTAQCSKKARDVPISSSVVAKLGKKAVQSGAGGTAETPPAPSQKSQAQHEQTSTVSTPKSAPVPAQVHLLVSGCDEEIRQMAHVLLDSANAAGLPALPPVGPAASLGEQHTAPVTHLVTDRPSKRTQKLLRALACGAWVLKPSWVMASLTGDSQGSSASARGNGNRLTASAIGIPWAHEAAHRWETKSCPASRLPAEAVPPFQGMVFVVAGLNTRSKRKPDPTAAEVKDILLRAGAAAVHHISARQQDFKKGCLSHQCVVLQGGRGLTAASKASCAAVCAQNGAAGSVPVLSLEWAWDCLWHAKVLDVETAAIQHLAVPGDQAPSSSQGDEDETPVAQPASAASSEQHVAVRAKRSRTSPKGGQPGAARTPKPATGNGVSPDTHGSAAARVKRPRRGSSAHPLAADMSHGSSSAASSPAAHSSEHGPSEAKGAPPTRPRQQPGVQESQSSAGSDDAVQPPSRRGSKRHRGPGINAAASAAARHAKRPRSKDAGLNALSSSVHQTAASPIAPAITSDGVAAGRPSGETAGESDAPVAVKAVTKSAAGSAPAGVKGSTAQSPLQLRRVSAGAAMLPQAATSAPNQSASTLSASGTPAKPPAPVPGRTADISLGGMESSDQRRNLVLSDDIEDSQTGGCPPAAAVSPPPARHSHTASRKVPVHKPTQINFQQQSQSIKSRGTLAGASVGTYSCDTEQNTLSEASGGASLPLGGARVSAVPLPLAPSVRPMPSRGLSQAESATVSRSSLSSDSAHAAPVSTPLAKKGVSRGGTGRASLSGVSAPAWSPASSIVAEGSPGHESVMSGVAFSLTGKEAESARKRSATKTQQRSVESKISPPGSVNHAHGTTCEVTGLVSKQGQHVLAGPAVSPAGESVSKTLTFIAAPVPQGDSQISEPDDTVITRDTRLHQGAVVNKGGIIDDSLSEGSQEW